ncbi:sensor histidine kinase [Streptococcus dysgalactiae]|uniref:sensor histidine kinase n=1 Tax=Streptococcus dysgalactiae TaxID=1334 RepID=UPI001CF46E64|nr:sensor histidine kinase [Streptococcus dysgalactiae]MCB2829590.1 sensor histidine kinase [Streptococcus dysgalactiae subsp. dysgalactiae]MCB2831757.1 sensor histidine kinase [Streptococcus dysgalactiae subsp. dysgalactiae]MCB2835464.1 sensor histidine kinase [Streptococcus dysgalactiae subsp. dysgalactiae]MCB2837669.1 sensor histidine kinase [Streptococcus dysgalactiae subsp. dysgalactiae]MCB2839535.1 sensor histidine kinase [Streptococcus dysgalactiae subsp. dysgalactiae]
MIKAFLKEYRFFYSQYAILVGIYWLVFYLYRLPMHYFLTANIISLTTLGLISLWKYYQFKTKTKNLQEFIYVTDLDSLTLPSDKVYHSLIIKLNEEASKKLLQQRNQQKNTESLIKMWSHQMKLPLSALSLMVQTQSTDVKKYQQQVFRLEKYLNNLLSYLKFKQHHDDFRFQMVSVREIISSIVKESRYLCIAKELSVTIQGNCQLKTDKKWLRFALMQLIDNAIKYSTKGGNITITLSSKSIIISDNGIGILSEDLPRLFDEGFTGFNGHEHQKATGLGLYMTKEILDQLNLDIKVNSLIGEGTQVIISPLTR